MKTVFRIFAILAAALVVVGALLAFTSGSSATGASAGPPNQSAFAQGQTTGSASAGFQRPEHGHSEEPSLGGIVEVLKNLVIIGVITAIVSGVKRLLGRKRPGGNATPRQTAPPAPKPSL